MIESARTTLGGIKKNLNHQKCPNKAGGMKKNPKDPKTIFEQKKKTKLDAQPNEENKNKKRELKPNTGGHDKPFWKDNSKDKRSGNKHK